MVPRPPDRAVGLATPQPAGPRCRSPPTPRAAARPPGRRRLITKLTNLAAGLSLSDVETCYKMFRAPLLRSIPLSSDDFAVEVEITIRLARRRVRILEVPIRYDGRSRREGKKITWRDGIRALTAIVRYSLLDGLGRSRAAARE